MSYESIFEQLTSLGIDGSEAYEAELRLERSAAAQELADADRKLAMAIAEAEDKARSDAEGQMAADMEYARSLAGLPALDRKKGGAGKQEGAGKQGGDRKSFEPSPDEELARSLELAAKMEQLELQNRLAAEEAASQDLLSTVEQYKISAHAVEGGITIGSTRYRLQECGGAHGGHYNLCGYLSLTAGNGGAAVALKQELAPRATAFAKQAGLQTDFAGLDTMMDTEVIRAYVVQRRTPVCVYNARAGVATSYRSAQSTGDCVYLYTSGVHFQRLVAA